MSLLPLSAGVPARFCTGIASSPGNSPTHEINSSATNQFVAPFSGTHRCLGTIRLSYATAQLTADGEWARLIRIDHSLLITELIRAEAFGAIDPPLLAAIMASIAHDDDRPGSFPRGSTGLVTLLFQVRKLAESLMPHEEPPMLRADVAALTERWVADQTLTWIGLARLTTMAEGDMFRLFARTIEFLSQLKTLKSTHPSLAESADRAIAAMRRGVLEELP